VAAVVVVVVVVVVESAVDRELVAFVAVVESASATGADRAEVAAVMNDLILLLDGAGLVATVLGSVSTSGGEVNELVLDAVGLGVVGVAEVGIGVGVDVDVDVDVDVGVDVDVDVGVVIADAIASRSSRAMRLVFLREDRFLRFFAACTTESALIVRLIEERYTIQQQ
jgi:hypothetical protein